MKLATRLASVVASSAMIMAAVASPAQADPQGFSFTLTCDNGETLTVTTTPADADWTPALVTGSTAVFRPTEFGAFTFTATPPGGTPVTETDPGLTKPGKVPPNADLTTCAIDETFTLTEEEADEAFPVGTVVTITGEVTGFFTGRP
jgi:hypothetical protein